MLLVLSSSIVTLFLLGFVSMRLLPSPLWFLSVPSPSWCRLVKFLTRSSNERLRVGSGILTLSAIVPTFFQFFLVVIKASFSHWVLLRFSQSISLVFLGMFKSARTVPELPTILPVAAIFCRLKPRVIITIRLKILLTIIFEIHWPLKFLVMQGIVLITLLLIGFFNLFCISVLIIFPLIYLRPIFFLMVLRSLLVATLCSNGPVNILQLVLVIWISIRLAPTIHLLLWVSSALLSVIFRRTFLGLH